MCGGRNACVFGAQALVGCNVHELAYSDKPECFMEVIPALYREVALVVRQPSTRPSTR